MAKAQVATGSQKPPVSVQRETVAQRYALLRTVVRCVAAVASLYIAKDMVIGLAGRDTFVGLRLAVLGDFKVAFSIALTGAACAWAVAERWLRHRKVTYMQDRIRELETKLDPKRTSSNLTIAGKTNPRDKRP